MNHGGLPVTDSLVHWNCKHITTHQTLLCGPCRIILGSSHLRGKLGTTELTLNQFFLFISFFFLKKTKMLSVGRVSNGRTQRQEERMTWKQGCVQSWAIVPKARWLGKNGRGIYIYKQVLEQWFSNLWMLRPFKTFPHVVVTPNLKIIFVATS